MARYIEKLQAAVRVSQPGEEPVDGWLSLSPQAQFHDGPETLLDLLNSAVRVIPLVRGAGQPVLLLTRLSLDWVMPAPDVTAERVGPRTYRVTREERVEVRFVDGRRIEGLVQMELPEDLNRASDFLNGAEDFFTLLTPFGILLVNKASVRETLVYQSSPRPVELDRPLG
jgi:hypothetical protein